jgi:hypothetical protein
MRIIAFIIRFGVAISLWAMSAGMATAGTITTFNSASGPGLESLSFNNILFGTANNDNVVGASDNHILINQKAFGTSEYIDMDFTVVASGGTTEYVLTEGLANNTSDTWTSYRIELGFGVGASFVSSLPGDGLDFDSPDFDSPAELAIPYFSDLVFGEDVITLNTGAMGPLSFSNLIFSLDVPDGITSFTIRQVPVVVPEPSTALLMLGGLAILSRRPRA